MTGRMHRLTRRQAVGAALGGGAALIAAGTGLFELVDHHVLPGSRLLDQLDGACDATTPPETFGSPGPTVSGSFYSRARGTEVGYAISYPPGYSHGDRLPFGLFLSGLGGNAHSGLGGMPVANALAGRIDGQAPPPPMAIVAADGGPYYWHAHGLDDPMAMLIEELVPMCHRIGLGSPDGKFAMLGVSMGGYGALLLAEKHPDRVAVVSSISPAIFPGYQAAINADPKSFSSPSDFAANDVVAHADALTGIPVRIASGASDPFHPGVVAMQRALPRGDSNVVIATGCHSGSFFASQQLQAISFAAHHLQPA